MKTFYFILLVSAALSSKAQFRVGAAYKLSLPQAGMRGNMNPTHNFIMDGMYIIPGEKLLSIGAEIGYGNYATLRQPVSLNFPGSSVATNTFINYNSNIASFFAVLQYDLIRKSPVTPYITAKAGNQLFFSRILVEDPTDQDGCRPLESKSINNDNAFAIGLGTGVRWELNSKVQKGMHFIDFGLQTIRGGAVDYVNTRNLKHTDHNATTTAQQTNPEATPVNFRFINVQSNVVHTHKVAELYRDKIRFIDVYLKYVMRF